MVVCASKGLSQDDPLSAFLFTLVTTLVLDPLVKRWNRSRYGAAFQERWIPLGMYVDDLYLMAASLEEMERMWTQVRDTFARVGFALSDPKSQWIASLPTGRKVCHGIPQNPVWKPMPILGVMDPRETRPDTQFQKNAAGAWANFRGDRVCIVGWQIRVGIQKEALG